MKGRNITKRLGYGGMSDVLFDQHAVLSIEDIKITRGEGVDEVVIISYLFLKTQRYSNDAYRDNGDIVSALFYIPIDSKYSDALADNILNQGSVKLRWYAMDAEKDRDPEGSVNSMILHAVVYWLEVSEEGFYTKEIDTEQFWNKNGVESTVAN